MRGDEKFYSSSLMSAYIYIYVYICKCVCNAYKYIDSNDEINYAIN